MSLHDSRPALVTLGTGHPRLYPSHAGHLYAGAIAGAPIRLRGAVTVIGSDPEGQVVREGLPVHAAEIRRDDHDEYVLTALSDRVSINGAVRSGVRLHTGDLIRCGAWSFSFARDESTDHGRLSHLLGATRPHGVIARWEQLLFLATGPGTRVRRRRHSRDPGRTPGGTPAP